MGQKQKRCKIKKDTKFRVNEDIEKFQCIEKTEKKLLNSEE